MIPTGRRTQACLFFFKVVCVLLIIVLSYLNVGNLDEVQLMKLILVLEGMLLNLNRSL